MKAMRSIGAWILFFACLAGVAPAPALAQQLHNVTLPSVGVNWSRAWVDVNGDGRDDFCYLEGLFEPHLVCHLTTDAGLGAERRAFNDLWQGKHAAFSAASMRWTDVNGDGFIDVCRAVMLDSPRLICRLGPNFVGTGFELPWTLAWGAEQPPGVAHDEDAQDFTPDFQLADVNGDGLADLCYFWRNEAMSFELRCRIASTSADRATVTYSPESAAWSKSLVRGAPNWPKGFFDFNGDGRADYCRVLPGGVLTCVISGPSGFHDAEVATPEAVSLPYREGAAFVDINADGNVDFCRIDGPNLGGYYLRCTLSNGRTWQYTNRQAADNHELRSVAIEPGDAYSRWWVDINGDGYPDFCRLDRSPDPIAGGSTVSVPGTLLCRLTRGGSAVLPATDAWAYSDVSFSNVNVGVADGGRAFCDPFGSGLPVFCRATASVVDTGQQECEEYIDGPRCFAITASSIGVSAGFSNTPSARHALLTNYSDGVGAETRIAYAPGTSPQVYLRSNGDANANERLLIVQPRQPLVFETRAYVSGGAEATRNTLTGVARYLYKDLVVDTWGGSRGFRERWVFHEGNNTLDHVVFYQGLGPQVDASSIAHDAREVGLVKCEEKFAVQSGLIPSSGDVPASATGRDSLVFEGRVVRLPERSIRLADLRTKVYSGLGALGGCTSLASEPSADRPFVLLQSTANTLGDTVPANPRFRHVATSVSHRWDWDGSARIALPVAETTTQMSHLGNVLVLVEKTTEAPERIWSKKTVNVYGEDDTSKWLLGRLTSATVTATAPSVQAQFGARASAAGNSPNATLMAAPGSQPAAPPRPLAPAALAAILELLLAD
ncbi:MAG: VCBS repeat-containing protein [Rhodoferax sp.]|nr:VCBS repeat-containing protein [Rhodoferax sp.]